MTDTSGHVQAPEERSCNWCGKPTRWVDTTTTLPACPGECTDELQAAFERIRETVNGGTT